MTTYSRPAKTVSGDGGTSMVEGNTLPAGELNDEFDNLTTHINDNLDETNLRAGTQIPNSMLVEVDGTKVADHADNDTTYLTNTTPGDTGTLSLPANLEEEHQRYRYRIRLNNRYGSNAQFMNASDALASLGWVEPPVNGTNLLSNPGFELQSGAANSAPDGWTLSGTPSTVAIEAAATNAAGADKRSLNIVTAAADDGIQVTITGLRSSTKYLFGCSYTRTTGTVVLTTAGGLGASTDYQDFAISDAASSSFIVRQGVVQTTSGAGDITVSLTGADAGAGGNDFNLHQAWFYELSGEAPREISGIPTQTATASTEDATLPTTFDTSWDSNWETDTALSLSQYVPGPGYKLIYEASISFGVQDADQMAQFGFRLRMNDGSDSTVDGPYFWMNDRHGSFALNIAGAGVMRLTHTVDNATPGVTYAFSYQVTAYNSAEATDGRIRLHPEVDPSTNGVLDTGNAIQSTSRARLRVERI